MTATVPEKSKTVCAVVVTFNRQTLLRECLTALLAQTRPLDEILVINNASTDATLAMLADEFPDITVLDLPGNIGGAGGFHAGMRWAYSESYDWLWLMDDDGRPAPDCLEALLRREPPGPRPAILVPVQQDSDGRFYGFGLWNKLQTDISAELMTKPDARGVKRRGVPVFHFVGPLISRDVVTKIGLPNPEFFIWFDDIEYALRAGQLGHARIEFVPDAVFHHNFGGKAREVSFLGRPSLRNFQPAWKEYYGARNYLYALTRQRRRPADLLHFLVHVQGRGIIGDLMYEEDRWPRVAQRLRGLRDGALGRLGKRT